MNATETESLSLSLNIHQRMLNVMRDISYVQKSEKTVNNQYRFVSHDSVTALVRGALVTHGIIATTSVVKHSQDGNRTEADVRVEFINVDAPADRVSIDAFGYGIDPQDKGPGKAISYAVKYAYLKAFALETGDDPERDSIDHKKDDKGVDKGADKQKYGNNGAEVCKIEFDALTPDEQTSMRLHGSIVIGCKTPEFATKYIEDQSFTHEERMALWYLLPSALRASIKKVQATQLSTQA